MKKVSVIISLISIIFLFVFIHSFDRTFTAIQKKEVEDIREILNKGYVKITFVDYEKSMIIGALPDGTKKRVHVIFAERRPNVDELWRVVEYKGKLKLTTQYVP